VSGALRASPDAAVVVTTHVRVCDVASDRHKAKAASAAQQVIKAEKALHAAHLTASAAERAADELRAQLSAMRAQVPP
jgi:hypothetical protein